MLAGISFTCFSASYLVALVLEVTRLFFRSGVRGALLLLFAGGGLLAHTLYLGHRAFTQQGAILSSELDWYLLAAWCLVVVYLYLTVYHPQTAFGLFVLPLVLGLVGVARFIADPVPFPRTEAAQVWGAIHGVFLLLGTVAVAVGFAVGLMALLQAYRLKHKLPPQRGLRLPSLEWLEQMNIRATKFSALTLGLGFVSGIVLNLIHDRLHVEELPWTDPIIWSSGLLLAWLVAATGFAQFYRPARAGRKVAYLTVASFVFLVLSLGSQWLLPTHHSLGGQHPGQSRDQPTSNQPGATRAGPGGGP